MTDRPVILVVGATGLFGGLLARRLIKEQRFSVIGTGRTRKTLDAFNKATGADTAIVNRDNTAEFKRTLELHRPFAVVDCAGPFQYYGTNRYRLAQLVLQAGSHYIDIADASDFVVGITELDVIAQNNSVAAISGVSSTPAISAAVVDHFALSLKIIASIETTIVPGNRTRRTLSVMQAILGQVGQPFQVTMHGKSQTLYGWSNTRSVDLSVPTANPVVNRLASVVYTPDIDLFPKRYKAQTVLLRAGLEIRFFHRALQLSGWLIRLRLMRSLVSLTPVARNIASRFEHLGSDIGGMQVVVIGQQDNGDWCKCQWEIAVDDGRGPEIPTLPVSVLLDKLTAGVVFPGARSAPGEITLSELNTHFDAIAAQTLINTDKLSPVFQTVLGADFNLLPQAVQQLHNRLGTATYEGRASSKGPNGVTGRIAAWLFGFPTAAKDETITVELQADPCCEQWQRTLAGKTFKSTLSFNENGYMQERFGPITIQLGLHVADGQLHYPVHSARLLGVIPLPKWMLPESIAHETIDEQGRFVFDVEILTPFGARIAHYHGWLVSTEELQPHEIKHSAE